MRAFARFVGADPYGNFFDVGTRARLLKLVSPRYAWSRLSVFAYERRHPDHPWLTRDAITRISGWLRPEHSGLEWGSGRGSLWFARRSRRLVSVEHVPAWHARVCGMFEREGIRNHDYRLVSEERYLSVIDEFADATFDYVLVDGLFRDEAFARSMPKLRPGGWMIFDNVNWHLPSESRTPHSRRLADGPATPRWAEVLERVRDWRTTWTTNGVNDTAIFEKPA
jgi:predicted O-methyltransferase YrrM